MRMTRAGIAARERLTARRLTMMLAVLLLTVVVLLIVAVAVGSESVNLATIFKIMVAEVSGRAADVTSEQRIIIAEIRLPRALMAMVVGAALAVAGAAYQALLKNPLADPGVLLLDEPYQGFDHGTYINFWDHCAAWRDAGKAVLVVTHMLAELGRADRVVELPVHESRRRREGAR